MNLNDLEELREYCCSDVAFERLKQVLLNAKAGCKDKRQQVLFQVISKLRESLDLNTIFTTTTIEVRQLLNADRVSIFRFYPDSEWTEGEFVSEDVLPEFHSALMTQIHDRCFGERYAVHYQNGQLQAVSDIYQAGLSDCHLEILRRFQIRANLAVPLLQGHQLWGLLCIHQCAAPRHWQADEIEFVSQIAAHLGVALQQAKLLEQTQQQSIELAQALRELKQNQTQLIQSEKLSSLGELITGLAHEINHPANFIYGNLTHASQYASGLLELLTLYRQECSQPSSEISDCIAKLDLDFLTDDFPKMLASMQIGADRIRQIVLSMRHFSCTDAAEIKSVNIHDGIDSTLLILQHRLKPQSDSTGIRVIKEYSQLPSIECYANQLNQVFMNILSNAIDALEEVQHLSGEPENTTRSCQQITIFTGLIPDLQTGTTRVIIRIADNGTGMTQIVQQQVFEPFFTTKPTGKGAGLGLSISQQIIVEQHGGVLECYSQPGEGTEFWIEIPTQQTSHQVSRQTPQQKTIEKPADNGVHLRHSQLYY